MNERIAEIVGRLEAPAAKDRHAEWLKQIGKVDGRRLAAYREARCSRDEGYRKMIAWRARLSSCLFKRWAKPGAVLREERSDSPMVGLVGCTRAELVAHIESLFEPGMAWENHGHKGWHLDHKRPVYMFDLESEEGFKAANHWSNLQPLWAEDHREKSKLEARAAGLVGARPDTIHEDMRRCGFSEEQLAEVGL